MHRCAVTASNISAYSSRHITISNKLSNKIDKNWKLFSLSLVKSVFFTPLDRYLECLFVHFFFCKSIFCIQETEKIGIKCPIYFRVAKNLLPSSVTLFRTCQLGGRRLDVWTNSGKCWQGPQYTTGCYQQIIYWDWSEIGNYVHVPNKRNLNQKSVPT